MTRTMHPFFAFMLAFFLGAGGAGMVLAQTQSKGRIVCWKDKSGKVVGCGDKIPPEYQDSASKEMDRRGVTRSTTDSAEEAAKRKAAEQEAAKQKSEEQKKIAEQKRQDSALLNTFSSEKEIDQKRDRDLQQADIQLTQMKTSLKNTTDRYNEAKGRSDAATKDKKGVPDALKDEVTKAAADKQRIEQNITSKEKEMEEIKARYAEQKRRWLELRGDTAGTTKQVERVR